MASWNIHPDATGLIFSPDLPHVIQACAEDVHIPYKTLLPMLNAHGQEGWDLLALTRREIRVDDALMTESVYTFKRPTRSVNR